MANTLSPGEEGRHGQGRGMGEVSGADSSTERGDESARSPVPDTLPRSVPVVVLEGRQGPPKPHPR